VSFPLIEATLDEFSWRRSVGTGNGSHGRDRLLQNRTKRTARSLWGHL